MGQVLNNYFKAGERSDGRRQRMCVKNVRTQIQSEMKYESTNLR